MNDAVLDINTVVKSYDSGSEILHVLQDLNLKMDVSESVAVMGASGCGKSTLLNLIGGLDRVDSGQIRACGFQIDAMGERDLTRYRSQKIGFVFQFHHLLKDFTALENLMLPAVMLGKTRKAAQLIAFSALDQVGVTQRANHYPSELSGGERQRVALARALINNPDLILADEPTGNLDEEHKALVADLIFSLTVKAGKSLILVTHAPDLAQRADRCFILREGRLIPA